jgi:hypothetical protein
MVMSGADKAIYVYRNGNLIGRARVEIGGRGAPGDHVFSLLEGTTGPHELSAQPPQRSHPRKLKPALRRVAGQMIADQAGKVCVGAGILCRAAHERSLHRLCPIRSLRRWQGPFISSLPAVCIDWTCRRSRSCSAFQNGAPVVTNLSLPWTQRTARQPSQQNRGRDIQIATDSGRASANHSKPSNCRTDCS